MPSTPVAAVPIETIRNCEIEVPFDKPGVMGFMKMDHGDMPMHHGVVTNPRSGKKHQWNFKSFGSGALRRPGTDAKLSSTSKRTDA